MRHASMLVVLVLLTSGCGGATLRESIRREVNLAGTATRQGDASVSVKTLDPPEHPVDVDGERFKAAMAWLVDEMLANTRGAPQAAIESGQGFEMAMVLLAKDSHSPGNPETGRPLLVSFDASQASGVHRVGRQYDDWCMAIHQPRDYRSVLSGNEEFNVKTIRRLALSFAVAQFLVGMGDEIEAQIQPIQLAATVGFVIAAYLATSLMPGIGIALTVALWAYLGAELFNVFNAWWQLTDDSETATSFVQVREAGERFGHSIGEKTARVLILLATASLGGKADFEAKLPVLPGYAEAAEAVGFGGSELTFAGAVGEARSVAIVDGRLSVALPASVVAMAASKPGTGRETGSRAGESKTSDSATRAGKKDASAKVSVPGSGKPSYKAFSSHKAFKRGMGKPDPGKQWHHWVEQTPHNVERFGAEALHNTSNESQVDELLHRQLSALYSSKRRGITGSTLKTVREWLRSQSYGAQRQFGLKAFKKIVAGEW